MAIHSSLVVDERVKRVLSMVAKGKFYPGESHSKLAKEWNISPIQVSRAVNEAFRYIRIVKGDDLEQEIARKCAQLEEDRRTALALEKVVTYKGKVTARIPAPDTKAAVMASRLYLEAIGALVRKPIETQKPLEGQSLPDLRRMRDQGRDALDELDRTIEQMESESVGVH